MKNKHQLHIEELSLKGVRELRRAINTFRNLRDAFAKNGAFKNINITQKIDGAPAIVFGTHPETGRFFVSTKSIFNKNPKLAYSLKEIREYFDNEEVQNKLYSVLKIFSKMEIDGIYQGDFLFDEKSKEYTVIGQKKHVAFKPNTITYAVEVDTSIGQKIMNAKLGIAIHTKYAGDEIESLGAQFRDIDYSQFEHSDVYIMSPKIDDISDAAQLDDDTLNKINATLSVIGREFNTIPSTVINAVASTDLGVLIQTFTNAIIKSGGVLTLDASFISSFENWVPTCSAVSKTKKNIAMELFYQNKRYIATLLNIYFNLLEIKNIFVQKLNQLQQDIKNMVFINDELRLTSPEGYCAVGVDNDIIKLVDRMEFSKLNFTIAKTWG